MEDLLNGIKGKLDKVKCKTANNWNGKSEIEEVSKYYKYQVN